MKDRDQAAIIESLRGFICDADNFPLIDAESLSIQDNLIEDGLIDSLGLFSIIGFIEETFGVTVANEDVVTENFGSIESMARYVLHREAIQP